jgi:hypothetical protein
LPAILARIVFGSLIDREADSISLKTWRWRAKSLVGTI